MNMMIESFSSQPASPMSPKANSAIKRVGSKPGAKNKQSLFGKALKDAGSENNGEANKETGKKIVSGQDKSTLPLQEKAMPAAALLPQITGLAVQAPSVQSSNTLKVAVDGKKDEKQILPLVMTISKGNPAVMVQQDKLTQMVKKAGFLPEEEKATAVFDAKTLSMKIAGNEAKPETKKGQIALQNGIKRTVTVMPSGNDVASKAMFMSQNAVKAAQVAVEQIGGEKNAVFLQDGKKTANAPSKDSKSLDEEKTQLGDILAEALSKKATRKAMFSKSDSAFREKQLDKKDSFKAMGQDLPQAAQEHENKSAAALPPQHFALQLDKNMNQPIAQPSEVQQPVKTQDVFNQIVSSAKLLHHTDNTQMLIKLHPDHLGELALKISVEANGAVSASFHTDNSQVRAMIETSLVQLRQDLQAQGIKVDNINVYSGLGDLLQQQGQDRSFEQQGKKNQARIEAIDAAERLEDMGLTLESTEQESSEPQSYISDSAVDYKI